MRRLAIAAVLLAGCGGDTSLLLDLSMASGLVEPVSLRATVFAQGVVGSAQTVPLAGRTLPGRLVVKPLDATLPGPRILVDALDADGKRFAQAASRFQLMAGQQIEVALVLGAPLADSDGDGVPDAIDDCPELPDPDQLCNAVVADAAVDQQDAAADLLRKPACPTPNLFCDDFETGDATKWSGKSLKVNSSLAVDHVLPWGGAYSLDVSAGPNPLDGGGFASTSASLDESLTNFSFNTVATRLYLRAPTAPGPFAIVLGLFAGTFGFGVGSDGAGNWVVTQDQSAQPDVHSTVPMPVDQWVCVEFIIDPPDLMHPQGRARLITDGTTILDFAPADFILPSELDVGLVRAPGDRASHVFIDDVVVAGQPIGCE